MKKIAFWILSFSFFLTTGCKKEENLFTTQINDLYIIKPDDSDPIKNRIYNIYKEHGVALFFTDTVGSYFVKNDINGDPVYRTETLDLGWYFTSYNNSKFEITTITDLEEQHKALDYVEKYLKTISKPLYPFSILLARQLKVISETNQELVYKEGDTENYFRTLVMTDQLQSVDTIAHFNSIVRRIIRTKINDYPDELNRFGAESKGEWYGGKAFSVLDPSVPAGTSVGILYMPALVENLRFRGFSEEYIENLKIEMRAVCGPFGFVSGNPKSGGYFTPSSMSDDLDGYVTEMLGTNKETFHTNWGAYPIVMKKYNILHDLILNKLGVDL